MKIAFVLIDLASSGAKVVEHNVAMSLSLSHEVHVFGFRLEDYAERHGTIHYHPIPISGILKELRSFLFLWKTFRREKFDYIFTVYDFFEFVVFLAARFAGILNSKKSICVFTIHNSTRSFRDAIFPLRIIIYFLFYSGLCLADKIIATSSGLKSEWKKKFFIKKEINVIYNPINIKTIQRRLNATDSRISKIKNKKVVMSIGRLSVQKNYPLLISSFKKVAKEIQNCELWIIGDGPERNKMENIIREQGLEDKVLLKGFDDNPFKYMALADLFVLSSNYEGLPTVLIEALVAGKQIISTDCPHGPREILDNGNFGLLVPVNDPAALADAIIKALNTLLFDEEILKTRGEFFSIENITPFYMSFLKGEFVDMGRISQQSAIAG